jgi:hypothetical protein
VSEEEKMEPTPEQSGSAGTGFGEAGKSPWPGLFESAAKALIPVFLTGASLVGFVAFAGAVIVWTRFDAIGVPPEQVVKAVPRNELVATGSSLLLLFGFFGVLAVLATYLVDRAGRATPGMSRALLLIVSVEGVIAVMLADGVGTVVKMIVSVGFLAFVGLAVVATFDKRFATYADELEPREGETKDPVCGPDSLHTALGNLRIPAELMVVILLLLAGLFALVVALVFGHPAGLPRFGAWALAIACGVGAGALLVRAWRRIEASREREALEAEAYEMDRRLGASEPPGLAALVELVKGAGAWVGGRLNPADKKEKEERAGAEAERLAKPRPHRLALRFWGVCLFAVFAGLAIAVPAVVMGQWWLAVSFAAAFLLATGVWRVAILSKPGFMWFGLVAFISVPLFGTCTLMARNVADPQVQPMALIRTTDGPGESIEGIYVTEASDRVYFASIATEGCSEKATADSGRLQWVPKSEVVAMSVGPLQDIDKAGRAAIEMSDALTPSIETPTGEQVSLSTAAGPPASEGEEGEAGEASSGSEAEMEGGGKGGPPESESGGQMAEGGNESGEGEEPDEGKEASEGGETGEEGKGEGGEETSAPSEAMGTPLDHRLTSAGPAIRPNFGTGLKLVPPAAEPGDVVELRMSAPNTDNGVDGFGEPGEGLDLRLNGVRLAVLRVPVQNARQAEYVKTVGGQVLPIVAYFEDREAEPPTEFVRIDPEVVRKVIDADGGRGNFTLKLAPGGKLAPRPAVGAEEAEAPAVVLRNGEKEELENVLLRRSWTPTKIKFRVPDNAHGGLVSVQCGQLGGQPVLDVVHPPVARVSVRMHPGTERLTLDSSRSSDEAEASPMRVWTVAGRRLSGNKVVSPELPPRLAPYDVSFTISDEGGLADRVDLHIWRLPSWSFFGPRAKRQMRLEYQRRIRDSLEEEASEGQPAAIELDAHADLRSGNIGHSLTEAERLRRLLFALRESKRRNPNGPGGAEADRKAAHRRKKAPDEEPLPNGGPAVPLLLRAYGESCPIVRHRGPQPVNGRVELFLLGPGATVGTGNHCHAARSIRAYW